nr:MAG TPA: endonuclease-like protein [Caudoviricetes sp.]
MFENCFTENGKWNPNKAKDVPAPDGFPDKRTAAYCELHKIEPKRCGGCGKILPIESFSKGWVKHCCSYSCVWKSDSLEKRKKTNMERYGDTSPLGGKSNVRELANEKFRDPEYIRRRVEKVKQTSMEKYGVDNPSKAPEVIERIRQTNLERFGVEWSWQSEHNKEQIKKTLMERYGVDHSSKIDGIADKRRQTNLERYGTSNPNQNEEVKALARKTSLERYGVEHWSKDPKAVERRKETFRGLYGVENPAELRSFGSERWLNKFTPEQRILFDDIELFRKEVSENSLMSLARKYKITEEGIKFMAELNGIECGGYKTSGLETKVVEFLKSEGIDVERSVRTILEGGREIDILIPSAGVGVECNGNYYHSYNPNDSIGLKDKNYHRKKMEAAEVAGVRLMQFFEDEINDKFDIVASMILNAAGKSEKIHARKTEAKIIDSKTARAFCEANHINGYTQSRLQIGLYHGDDLVSVMTFSPSRYEKRQGAWEIVRFCSILNHTVVGGASKLIAAARKHVGQEMECLLTYADLMHGTGNGYKACGFKEIGRTEVGYFWYGRHVRESRQKYQRHKLEKVFNETFPKEMTENDIMFSKGYRKLYNAGNAKFILEF